MIRINPKILAGSLLLMCTTNIFGTEHEIRGASFGVIKIDLPESAVIEEKRSDRDVLDYSFENDGACLLLTFILGSDVSGNFTDEKIKNIVFEMGQNFLSSAVEEKIDLFCLKGTNGAGYYYSLTDKAPKPDEYKYVTQGLVRFGEIVGKFTVLHNDDSMKQKSLWISVLETLQQQHDKSSSSDFDKLRLTSHDIENMATFSNELHLYSMQTSLLYKNPEISGVILPKCIAKEYQSVSDGVNKGSILYFKFDSNLDGSARGYLTGLLYGESGKPSSQHPEIIEVKNDMLIIYSFPYKSALSKKVQKLITPRL